MTRAVLEQECDVTTSPLVGDRTLSNVQLKKRSRVEQTELVEVFYSLVFWTRYEEVWFEPNREPVTGLRIWTWYRVPCKACEVAELHSRAKLASGAVT